MIEHTPGELNITVQQDGFFVVPRRKPSGKELVGNFDLLTMVLAAPHECSDPQCPGNVNRRKLEAFDRLLAVCERYHAQFRKEVHRDEVTALSLVEASSLYNDACAALAKAQE